jgi:hypothetical protein
MIAPSVSLPFIFGLSVHDCPFGFSTSISGLSVHDCPFGFSTSISGLSVHDCPFGFSTVYKTKNVSSLPLSTMCRLDFGALPTVVFFGFVIFFH